jgi:hypothetical protein
MVVKHDIKKPGYNKKYMTIAVSVVCEQRLSTQTAEVREWHRLPQIPNCT